MRAVFSKISFAASLSSITAALFIGSGQDGWTVETLVMGKAHAFGGGGGGAGVEPATVERVSVSSFLTLSGHQLYRLDLRNARVDTSILIGDFGETRSKQLIAAAVRDRRTIRIFLRGLAGAKSIAERDRVWEQTRQRIEARYELLGKDERHTYSQIGKNSSGCWTIHCRNARITRSWFLSA